MRQVFLIVFVFLVFPALAQKQTDSSLLADNTLLADTSILGDEELFSELDQLFDDLNKSNSFAMANVTVGNAYFTFQRRANDSARSLKKMMVSPALAYFHKSGLGLAAEASLVNDGEKTRPYQYSVTGSFDYLKNRSFVTGVAFSRYFVETNLPFYTSPLQNDAFFYFTYRKRSWRPSINVHYGWGSETSVQVQKEKLRNLRTTRTVTTIQQVADLNVTASLRYQTSWSDVFGKKDMVRLMPQVSLISGTQQYGFNQVASSVTGRNNSGKNSTTTTQKLLLYDNLQFRPLSAAAFLKAEYSRGRFFIQPQLIGDYYIPATRDNFTVTFMINTGVTFF